MKLHYSKILLFCLPLNILVSSSYEYSKNKSYITPNTPTTTSRGLSECDIHTTIYDDDPDMKYVKENFDRQTSQRFEEYNERMIRNRQKYKEQCDKDIQQIILKDKVKKSLSEKVEIFCLKCGFGLGGGLAPFVGLFGALAVNEVKKTATAAATKAGMEAAIEGLVRVPGLKLLLKEKITDLVTTTNFKCQNELVAVVQNVKTTQCVGDAATTKLFCKGLEPPNASRIIEAAAEAGRDGADAYITMFSDSTTITAFLTHPIVISTVVVISIALTLLIIYLILHYRRKTKMNKKLQYIKILKK